MAIPYPKEPDFEGGYVTYEGELIGPFFVIGMTIVITLFLGFAFWQPINQYIGVTLENFIGFVAAQLAAFAIAMIFFALRVGLHFLNYEKNAIEAYKAYNVDLAAYAASQRKERMEKVNATAAKLAAKQKALAQQREEQARRLAQIEEQNRRERIKTWEEAFSWARVSFEQQYHGFALTLAAEQGITNPDDVLRVFAEAYPHLNISSDWRMGCLREMPTDRRVAAILRHLPPNPRRPS